MQLDQATQVFLASTVMIVIAGSNRLNRPAVGRGLGIRINHSGQFELLFSRWQWSDVAACITETGRLAVTCSRPSDYVTYQVKGRAGIREAQAEDVAQAEEYRKEMGGVLLGLGIAPQALAEWMVIEHLVVAQIDVAEAYLQTPGPRAGTTL